MKQINHIHKKKKQRPLVHLTEPHSAAKFLLTSVTVNVIRNQKPLKTNTDLLGSQNENINNQ